VVQAPGGISLLTISLSVAVPVNVMAVIPPDTSSRGAEYYPHSLLNLDQSRNCTYFPFDAVQNRYERTVVSGWNTEHCRNCCCGGMV